MYGYDFRLPDGKVAFSSSDNLFRLVHIANNQPRAGSLALAGLAGQGDVVVIAHGTGWRGGYSSKGGIQFMRDFYHASGNTLSWNVPLTTQVGGMHPPLDNIDLNSMFIFVR